MTGATPLITRSMVKAVRPFFANMERKAIFYVCILLLMFFYSVVNGAGNYGPTYAQEALGASSQIAGLINVPGMIVAVILTTVFGNYASKTGRYKGMVMIWAAGAVVGGVLWALMGAAPTSSVGLLLLFAGAFPLCLLSTSPSPRDGEACRLPRNSCK